VILQKEWSKNGRDYVKYCVPNEELPDVFNTVLKMSAKRALVDATLKLPLVSELFTQDLEEQIAKAQETKPKERAEKPKPVAAKPVTQAEVDAEITAMQDEARSLLAQASGEDDEARKRILKGRQIEMMSRENLGHFIDELMAQLEVF